MQHIAALTANMAEVRVKVTKAKSVTGDMSVACIRGTDRYLYDMTAEVDFTMEVNESPLAADGLAPTSKKKV